MRTAPITLEELREAISECSDGGDHYTQREGDFETWVDCRMNFTRLMEVLNAGTFAEGWATSA